MFLRFRWRFFLLLLLGLQALPSLAMAAPAPWHWWVSRVDGARICAQVPPGEGWVYLRGPYQDAQCRRPAAR